MKSIAHWKQRLAQAEMDLDIARFVKSREDEILERKWTDEGVLLGWLFGRAPSHEILEDLPPSDIFVGEGFDGGVRLQTVIPLFGPRQIVVHIDTGNYARTYTALHLSEEPPPRPKTGLERGGRLSEEVCRLRYPPTTHPFCENAEMILHACDRVSRWFGQMKGQGLSMEFIMDKLGALSWWELE